MVFVGEKKRTGEWDYSTHFDELDDDSYGLVTGGFHGSTPRAGWFRVENPI